MFLEVRDVETLMADVGPPSWRCLGLEVRAEIEAGENYGSTFLLADALFLDAEGDKHAVPVACKRLPPTEYLRKTFNVDVSFAKEANFYRAVVPAMNALQRDLGVAAAERMQAFPKLCGARIGGRDPRVVDEEAILVLEDLTAAGYRCGNRNKGLDMEHCRLAVCELARFHALGLALRRVRPDVFAGQAVREACAFFMHNRMAEYDASIRSFRANSLDTVLGAVPELADLVGADALRTAVLAEGEPCERREPLEPFACVVHADFWVNNMMFAYDERGRPDRMKMVDFQLTEVGSPASDLLFFVYSSADSAALARADELIREYHGELVRYARLHGLDAGPLSWDAFACELRTVAKREFSHVFYMTCIIRAQTKVEKADTNSDDAFSKQLGISGPARTRYLETVTDFAKRGWI